MDRKPHLEAFHSQINPLESLPKPGLREKASRVWHDTTSEILEGPMAFQQVRSADINHRGMTHAQQAADRKLPYHVRVDQAEQARGNR